MLLTQASDARRELRAKAVQRDRAAVVDNNDLIRRVIEPDQRLEAAAQPVRTVEARDDDGTGWAGRHR